jgi:hypothetical protein
MLHRSILFLYIKNIAALRCYLDRIRYLCRWLTINEDENENYFLTLNTTDSTLNSTQEYSPTESTENTEGKSLRPCCLPDVDTKL